MGLITSCLAFARNGLGLEPVSNAPAFNNSNMQPGMVSNIDPARIMGTRPRILRHRCRIRILHSLIIATSVCVLIVDIAGRVTSEDDPISTMMPAIWIGIPACTAASFGICSMSRYTTPYRRKCLFTAQYVFFIFCCMLIIGLGIYMATEFRSYMDKAEYINPINPVVNMQGNATVTAFPMSISLQQTINRSLIVIRAVELSFMMLLLILCIVSACLVGRELCPECGCDCDCDCDDDDMRPVAPVQPPAAQRAAPTVTTPEFYEYFGRQPQYITVPTVPVISQPFMAEEARHEYSPAANTGLEQIRRATGKLFRRVDKGPAPTAPPPPSYSEATKETLY